MISITNLDSNCTLSIEYTKTNIDNSISYIYLIYNSETPSINEVGCFNDDSVLPLEVSLSKDGYYTISSITLINQEQAENKVVVQYNDEELYLYSINGSIKYNTEDDETLRDITNDMLLNILLNNEIENIQNINYISICFLKQCYISICQKILSTQLCSRCKIDNLEMNDLRYKRDLIWMSLNVIQYLVEFCQLYEAHRIIEQLTNCNGICKNEFRTSKGCGCS